LAQMAALFFFSGLSVHIPPYLFGEETVPIINYPARSILIF